MWVKDSVVSIEKRTLFSCGEVSLVAKRRAQELVWRVQGKASFPGPTAFITSIGPLLLSQRFHLRRLPVPCSF